MHYHVAAVHLRPVVNAKHADRLLRNFIKEAKLYHLLRSARPLLCRLEHEEHVIRQAVFYAAQIMHGSKQCRRMRVMTAKMLRSVLRRKRVDIRPKSDSLSPSRVKPIYRACFHADIYQFDRIVLAGRADILCCPEFRERFFRHLVKDLAVFFRKVH